MVLDIFSITIAIMVNYQVSVPSGVFAFAASLNLGAPISAIIYEFFRDKYREKALVKKLKEKETEDEKEIIKGIDSELNIYSVKQIVKYFMVLGVAAFISLGITAVGLIRNSTDSNILVSSIPASVIICINSFLNS